MKRKTQKRKRKSRVAIVPTFTELRLGSLAASDGDALLARAERLAATLARVLPEKGFITDYGNKKWVKVQGWSLCGALLGVVPVEELCERLPEINGYRAVVRLERVCDGKMVGRASAVGSLNEKVPLDFSLEEFATYSKTITRATGKAYRLTYGWLMKLAGFEDAPADEIFDVEGTQETADDVARRKIEEKLGRPFKSLAEAEAALMDDKERKKQEKEIAKKTVLITWPEAHAGTRFLLVGRHLIWQHKLHHYIEDVCEGLWSDREGGWFISAAHAEAVGVKIRGAGIQLQETRLASRSETQTSTPRN